MAVEIRELVIKTTVSENKENGRKGKASAAGKEQIIQECVDKVMEILKYEKGR